MKYEKRQPWSNAIEKEEHEQAWLKYIHERSKVANWTEEEFEAWLRTQLKPEFKDVEISFRDTDLQTTGEAFCKGWLLAYRSGGRVRIWRGNQVSIHAHDYSKGNRPRPEYYTYPESPY